MEFGVSGPRGARVLHLADGVRKVDDENAILYLVSEGKFATDQRLKNRTAKVTRQKTLYVRTGETRRAGQPNTVPFPVPVPGQKNRFPTSCAPIHGSWNRVAEVRVGVEAGT